MLSIPCLVRVLGMWSPSLLVSVGLYCGGGAFYNHRKYMLPFPDNLPQRELWRELPIMGTRHAGCCQSSPSHHTRCTHQRKSGCVAFQQHHSCPF